MQKDIRKLSRELLNQGFSVRTTSKGHLQVRQGGFVVAVLAGTPSDHRSLKNSVARLRRFGFVYATSV